MTVGMQGSPLTSTEPMKIARRLVGEHFRTSNGREGVFGVGGDYLVWDGRVWHERGIDWMEMECWRALEDAYVEKETQDGGSVIKRYAPDRAKVNAVAEAVRACVREVESLPRWATEFPLPSGGVSPSRPDAGHVIAFQDVLVDVQASAKAGQVVTCARDEGWIDNCVLPVTWEEAAKAECPTWERACKEWGEGDEEWTELLERYMGYTLMGTRKYARWLLMDGKIRGGKGTAVKVLKGLMGRSLMGTTLSDLAGDFGKDGLEMARGVAVGEVTALERREGEKVAGIIKMVMGEDEMTVNVKFRRQRRGVVVRANIYLMSNEIPELPDKGRGVSGKMLLLPYRQSWVGREDTGLGERLRQEAAGVARRLVEASLRLEAAEVARKWPTPHRATEALMEHVVRNNPWAAFWAERGAENQAGKIEIGHLKRTYEAWCEGHGLDWREHGLIGNLTRNCPWTVRVEKTRGGGEQMRVMRGVSLKMEPDEGW